MGTHILEEPATFLDTLPNHWQLPTK